jgi:response regulator RpfG family c-di-GMP phosphodiesterase
MTSDRPYRSALPFEEAHDEIRRGLGSRYDSRVANVFLSVAIESWKAIRHSIEMRGSASSERMEGGHAGSPNHGSRVG